MPPISHLAVVLLFLAAGLAGCLSGDAGDVQTFDPDDSSYVPPEEQAAAEPEVEKVDEEMPTGSIVGKVLSDEQLPVGNATVTLVGYNTTAKTTRLGDFKFGVVNAGDYFLVVRHPDYKEKQVGVSVEPETPTEITVNVESKPKPVPHVSVIPTRLYVSCRVLIETPAGTSDATGAKSCGDPTGENSEVRWKDVHNDDPEALIGLVGILGEIEWERTTEGSKCLEWEIMPSFTGTSVTDWVTKGESPLALTITKDALEAYLAEDPENRKNYYRDGGSFRIWVEPDPCVLGTPVDVGFAIDQVVEVNLSLFFVNEPEDYEAYRAFS